MNHIASTGILLFGLGYCIQSIASAFAFPSGPSVSMGSNPIESFYGSTSNGTLNLNANYDFILTSGYSDSSACLLNINGTNVGRTGTYYNIFYYNSGYNPNSEFTQGQGQLSIPAGATVTFSGCSNHLFSGYYVQP